MSFMERVVPVVDETIQALAKTKFVPDPVAGSKYSRATSIVSSAYKRHGRILETALRESLRESNRHKVWQEDAFRVSRAADALVGSQTEDACRQTTLPYGDSVRSIQVDVVAFDSADQTIRAYEVKRGNGQFDAGKIRSIKRDLMCIQVLLSRLRQRRPDHSSLRSQTRKWPIRRRQDSLDQTRFDVHSGSAQELRRRVSQAQSDRGRISDHLLLRRSFNRATLVVGKERIR
jgi:hypothetical protein